MNTALSSRYSSEPSHWPQVVFTVAEARRALQYVSSIVRDAAEAYHAVQRCRAALASPCGAGEASRLAALRDQALGRLSVAADDCNAVGADLLDISQGRVRFPAAIDGRPLSLVWRLGDSTSDAWPGLE